MPVSTTFVAFVEGFHDPDVQSADGRRVVSFKGGRQGWLDGGNPETARLAMFLRYVEGRSVPVLASLSGEGAVEALMVSRLAKVLGVESVEHGIEVALEGSHAAHTLTPDSNPRFDDLHAALRRAHQSGSLVSVTETPDDYEIVDVRDVDPACTRGNAGVVAVAHRVPAAGGVTAMPPLTTLPKQDADDRFTAMTGETCSVNAIGGDCIPFLYPNDGCQARAHRMCEVLANISVTAGKVWLFGSGYPRRATLLARTRNSPRCKVRWLYHSAAVVQVAMPGGLELRVFDPSLFGHHVSPEEWKSVQGDVQARLEFTSAAVRDQAPNQPIAFDDDFSDTPEDLVAYQARLLNRVARQGPPPYACP